MKKKLKKTKPKNTETTHHSAIYRLVRKMVVLIIGGSVLLFGIALIFLPGPSVIVIPIGLTILATEFIWARHLLRQIKFKLNELKNMVIHKR